MKRLLIACLSTMLFALGAFGGITADEYQARRERLAKAIGPNAMLILMSPEPALRNGDVEWPFRQDDNLLYLTGVNFPGIDLAIIPSETEHRDILFAPDRNPVLESWTGKIPTHEDLTRQTGIDQIASNSRFARFLDSAFSGGPWGFSGTYRSFRGAGFPSFSNAVEQGKGEVWMILESRGTDEALTPELQMVEKLRRRFPELRFRDATNLLRDMREIKSPAEIALIQKAIDITAEAQKAGMRRALTAKNENEIQATIEYTFRDLGACCWGFPSIVASGANSTILHYEKDDEPVQRSGLVLTDIGAEVEGYTADVTRTYPADGTFSPDQRAIYEAVLRAQNETIPMMRPGAEFSEIHVKAMNVLGEELLKLGLVTKNDPEQVRLYFFHGLGHHMGLRVHDVSNRSKKLSPGMVITNEPGIYVRKDDVLSSGTWAKLSPAEQKTIAAALDRYAGIGVRIEDDVLVTANGPKLLSGAAPRSVQDIESWMAAQ